MRRILVFITLPILFVILGGYLFEFSQRVPKGDWKMIWGNEYELYNLDSSPIQVLDAEWDSIFIKTAKSSTYFCDHEFMNCELFDYKDAQDTITLEISREIPSWQVPAFDQGYVDMVRLSVGLPETISYQYYLIALDGSIWFWYWGDNIYVDISGWGSYGCLGGLIGLFIAFLVRKKLE